MPVSLSLLFLFSRCFFEGFDLSPRVRLKVGCFPRSASAEGRRRRSISQSLSGLCLRRSCLSSRDPYCVWLKSGGCVAVSPGFK